MSIENQIEKLCDLNINNNDKNKFIYELREEINFRKKKSKIRVIYSSMFICLFILSFFSFYILSIEENNNYFFSEEFNIQQKENFDLNNHNIHFESIDYLIENSDLIISECLLSCDLVKNSNTCIVNFTLGI
tara:strand:+ start:144699 stop:145094 length:396 start_codon:yes stop_codon:yes gene_type:complete